LSVLAALREGAAELLEAEGHGPLAEQVRGAELELVGPSETWSVGSREVTATALAVALAPAEYVALHADPDGVRAVERAFATLLDTPETKLAGAMFVVRLPGLDVPYHHAYRQAPVRLTPERPAPETIQRAAVALLEARGDAEAAEVLAEGRLDAGEHPNDGPELLLAWTLALGPTTFVRVDADRALADRVSAALRSTATRALVRFAGVELVCDSAEKSG